MKSRRRRRTGTGSGAYIALSSSTIAEDAAVSSVVGALSVPGQSGYAFSITADPENKFAISGSNLIIDQTLDYESDTSHPVSIQATKSGFTTLTATFNITVTDVSEGGGGGYPAQVTAASWDAESVWDLQYGENAGYRAANMTKVIGVDTFKDDANSSANITDNSYYFQIAGSNRTFTGWDFSGYSVYITGTNITFVDCYFHGDAPTIYLVEVEAGASCTVTRSTLDGSDQSHTGGGSNAIVRNTGTLTFNYMRSRNSVVDGIKSLGTLNMNNCHCIPHAWNMEAHHDPIAHERGACTISGLLVDARNWTGYPSDITHPSINITGAANNGSGKVRLTLASVPANWSTYPVILIAGVVGTTEANGTKDITVIDGTHVDLTITNFSNSYVSGGTATLAPVSLNSYIFLQAQSGNITSASVEHFIGVGQAVSGGINPIEFRGNTGTVANGSFTNNIWQEGANGSHFYEPTDVGAIVAWSSNIDYDTGATFPQPST